MKIRQKHFNYQKSQGTEQNNKRKEIDELLLSQKKISPYQARKNFQNQWSLSKLCCPFYVLCAIVAYVEEQL